MAPLQLFRGQNLTVIKVSVYLIGIKLAYKWEVKKNQFSVNKASIIYVLIHLISEGKTPYRFLLIFISCHT